MGASQAFHPRLVFAEVFFYFVPLSLDRIGIFKHESQILSGWFAFSGCVPFIFFTNQPLQSKNGFARFFFCFSQGKIISFPNKWRWNRSLKVYKASKNILTNQSPAWNFLDFSLDLRSLQFLHFIFLHPKKWVLIGCEPTS